MSTILILTAICAIILVLIFVIHQEILFARIIKQNNILLAHADERLESANAMVKTLAHSADKLSTSVSHMKDMMIHLEQVYTSRNDQLQVNLNEIIENRDDFKDAYNKLLKVHVALQAKHDKIMDESMATLKELAARPTSVNNNNIGEQ